LSARQPGRTRCVLVCVWFQRVLLPRWYLLLNGSLLTAGRYIEKRNPTCRG